MDDKKSLKSLKNLKDKGLKDIPIKASKKNTVLLLAENGLLCACAIVLSILESLLPDLPFPVPGMKPGLANIATMTAIEAMGFSSALYVTLAKSLFVFVTRGATAFLMSFSGGIVSMLVMYLLLKCRKPAFGCIGTGIAGAFCHNAAQLAMASLLTNTLIFYYLPFVSAVSLVTGSVTGTAVYFILPPVLSSLKRVKANEKSR